MTMTEAANDIARTPSRGPRPIAEILKEFVDGFNTNSLDEVMTFFAEDAVYEPGNGRTHRGRVAIRAELAPQFANAYGTMRFLVNDQVIDEGARKATIRWLCQHDLTTVRSPLQRWLFRLMYGRSAGWYGTDTFHFDERGKITGKFSYANYGRRPQIRRDLGVSA
jgi:ketosteroid isomerase-like protein